MKNLVLIVIILLSNFIYSDSYESAQRFDSGDVMSAEVLNDILERIELTLKEIKRDELLGSWIATQYWCGNSGVDPTTDATLNGSGFGCSREQLLTGGSSLEGGLALKRTDNVTISAVSSSETLMDVAFEARSMFVPDGVGDAYPSWNESKTHQCSVLGEGAIFGCTLDASITTNGRRIGAYFNVQRLSPTRIKLFWGPWRGAGLFNVVFLDKVNLSPVAPTSLAVAPSSSATVSSWEANTTYALNDEVKSDTNVYTVTTEGISGSLAPIHLSGAEENGSATLTFKESVTAGSAASVTLSWTAGDNTDVNFDIRRKDSSEGAFTSLGTSTESSYVDTTVVTGKTYWFRIFAINDNGTSLGSNVIRITL